MKENDIRPKELFDEYKRLCELDNKKIFTNCKTIEINCPACDSNIVNDVFEKDKFQYKICKECETIYLSPRPFQEYFDRYYSDGESVKYWSTTFYPSVEMQRKEKIYAPRVVRIKKFLQERGFKIPIKLVDIGSGYGSFLEEVRNGELSKNPEGIEPNNELASVCEKKGFKIYKSNLENVEGLEDKFDVAISFEVLEHLYNIKEFINKANKIIRKGGILLLTTLSGTGYDIKMLKKDHDNVKPPHHINFINPFSAYILLKSCGFSKIYIETPGKLDVDILCNRVDDYPYLLNDLLFKTIYEGNKELKNTFQNFLVDNNLSSHVWMWAKK